MSRWIAPPSSRCLTTSSARAASGSYLESIGVCRATQDRIRTAF